MTQRPSQPQSNPIQAKDSAINTHQKQDFFTRFSTQTARISGQSITFCAAMGVILIWAISGPFFKFSDTWQLVINTGTTIITFLMVFLIQNTQNRDSGALHLKLDELIRASEGAHNEIIEMEDKTQAELDARKAKFEELAERDLEDAI